MKQVKTSFKDLNWVLRAAVIMAWINIVFTVGYIALFLIGVVIGFMGLWVKGGFIGVLMDAVRKYRMILFIVIIGVLFVRR